MPVPGAAAVGFAQRHEAMEFRDKSLVCVECHQPFVWTAGEQLFYADKNFKNEPKRCKGCKAKRASRPAGASAPRERVETVTTCSACGKPVADSSKPGQRCPHCGVVWGGETETVLPDKTEEKKKPRPPRKPRPKSIRHDP